MAPEASSSVMNYSPSEEGLTESFLLGLLNSYNSGDVVLANAWIETLLDALDLLPPDVIQRQILGLAIAKAQISESVSSRKASTRILGKIAGKLDGATVRCEILPTILHLCQDAEDEIRESMCQNLSSVFRGVGLETTKSLLLPQIVEMSGDSFTNVRLASFLHVFNLLGFLDNETIIKTIVPLSLKSFEFLESVEDINLPKYAHHLGHLLNDLCNYLTLEQKCRFFRLYRHLSTLGLETSSSPMPDLLVTIEEDKYVLYIQCRKECAYNFPSLILFASEASFSKQILVAFNDFVNDPHPSIRRNLASCLHECLKYISGDGFSEVKGHIVKLFLDFNISVLEVMVRNMVHVIDALARYGVLQFGQGGQYCQDLSDALLQCEKLIGQTRNWRLHADILEKFSCLANCISPQIIQKKIIPLLFHRIQNCRPLPCRVAAARTLLVIFRFTVKSEEREYILNKLRNEYGRGKSCHSRMLFIRICELAISLFSKNYFKLHFFKDLLVLSGDKVPNVRYKVVCLLPRLKSLLTLPKDRCLLLYLENCVKERMLHERDADVRSSLQISIQNLSLMDSLSKDTLNEDRKLREEELISSMEEQINRIHNDMPPIPHDLIINDLFTSTENSTSTQRASPYSSTLENLDPRAKEFLVDAGIVLEFKSSSYVLEKKNSNDFAQEHKNEEIKSRKMSLLKPPSSLRKKPESFPKSSLPIRKNSDNTFPIKSDKIQISIERLAQKWEGKKKLNLNQDTNITNTSSFSIESFDSDKNKNTDFEICTNSTNRRFLKPPSSNKDFKQRFSYIEESKTLILKKESEESKRKSMNDEIMIRQNPSPEMKVSKLSVKPLCSTVDKVPKLSGEHIPRLIPSLKGAVSSYVPKYSRLPPPPKYRSPPSSNTSRPLSQPEIQQETLFLKTPYSKSLSAESVLDSHSVEVTMNDLKNNLNFHESKTTKNTDVASNFYKINSSNKIPVFSSNISVKPLQIHRPKGPEHSTAISSSQEKFNGISEKRVLKSGLPSPRFCKIPTYNSRMMS